MIHYDNSNAVLYKYKTPHLKDHRLQRVHHLGDAATRFPLAVCPDSSTMHAWRRGHVPFPSQSRLVVQNHETPWDLRRGYWNDNSTSHLRIRKYTALLPDRYTDDDWSRTNRVRFPTAVAVLDKGRAGLYAQLVSCVRRRIISSKEICSVASAGPLLDVSIADPKLVGRCGVAISVSRLGRKD